MKRKKPKSDQSSDLRSQAEAHLNHAKSPSADSDSISEESRLLHELQVHQLELEMQNEELLRAKLEAENALAKYSDLYEFAPIGLFTLQAFGPILEVNLTGAKLLGVERNVLLKSRFEQFIVHEDRQALEHSRDESFLTGVKQTCVVRLLQSEGPQIHVRIECTATHDSLVNDKRFRIAVIDVTERVRAEEARQETQDYLEKLIGYANAPIIVWDTSFKITRFNHAIENLTGLKEDEVLGKSLGILFPEESRETSMEYIVRTSYGEHWEGLEMPIRNIDGSIRTILWNTANIYDKQRIKIIATIAQGQDITERKQAEEQLRKARDDLELKVLERTNELQSAKGELEISNKELQIELEAHQKLEAELIKAKEAAEAAVEAKAAFLANMSHELRTPMNAVIGFSSLLLDDNLTSGQKEYIEGIRAGGEALLSLVNDILDFSRADKEKVELEHRPISLRHCVEEALDMVAIRVKKKGLILSYAVSYGTPNTIIADHGRLRQILVNLLGNAVKFTDAGEISVSISAQRLEGNRYRMQFNIKDTGMGIPQDKMKTIFEPFTQVERVISRKRDGVGLGLAISKKLVDLMGGEIWAESLPGQGSIFHFTIQAEAMPGRHFDFSREEMGPVKSLPGQNALNILVAEDNPSNQKVLVEMLTRMGCRPDAVSDGKEALQSPRDEVLRPDIHGCQDAGDGWYFGHQGDTQALAGEGTKDRGHYCLRPAGR